MWWAQLARIEPIIKNTADMSDLTPHWDKIICGINYRHGYVDYKSTLWSDTPHCHWTAAGVTFQSSNVDVGLI